MASARTGRANASEVFRNVSPRDQCLFLGVAYEELRAHVRAGGTDDEILAWVEARGHAPTDAECMGWNRFMVKLGWRDDRSALLQVPVAEFGLTGKPI